MEDRSRASSNEFCSNHRMNIAWIIEWILFESSNENRLNCFINVGENRMHIKANLSNFATSLSNVLNKIKYIWILLSICGNYQTHICDIEYWHNPFGNHRLGASLVDSSRFYLILPIALHVWMHCGKTAAGKLEKLNEHAMRCIFNDNIRTYDELPQAAQTWCVSSKVDRKTFTVKS